MLGSPIRHSLSPALHRAAYAEIGLDWRYDAYDVDDSGLAGFVAGLDGSWRGLSLTMPLKRTVLPLLDDVTEGVRRSGAANTVVLGEGRLSGHNTDIPGAAAAIRERYDGPLGRSVVLGGGATATSAVFALADLGCAHVTLVVRDPARAAATVAAAARHPEAPTVDVRLIGSGPVEADIVVSTIPAPAQTEAVVALAGPVAAVLDVVYDPWPTPLARYAESSGRTLVSGLDLLVHQAVRQVELMTGVPAGPLTAMRAAGERALRERASTGPGDPPV